MKIESFHIKNLRSIKDLKIDNLNSINVFFGKNNVGKSNILRGIFLAFYCLKNDEIYLSDAMFFNRNIYRPVEIMIKLSLGKGFLKPDTIHDSIQDGLDTMSLSFSEKDKFIKNLKELDDFIRMTISFTPLEKLELIFRINYSEDISNIGIIAKDLMSKDTFDFGKYRSLYNKLNSSIIKQMKDEYDRLIFPVMEELRFLGIDVMDRFLTLKFRPTNSELFQDVKRLSNRLKDAIYTIKDSAKKRRASIIIERIEEFSKKPRLDAARKSVFNTYRIIEKYFEKISDNFVLLPNREFYEKSPLDEKDGEEIEIFNEEGFEDKLASLIDSPSKKERNLIEKFLGTFNNAYSDIGKLETITKFRDEVLAIFGNNLISLPLAEQGAGVQDLFNYLALMILFESSIVAIEEPERTLSSENQGILYNIIKKVYLGTNKQIFISSHSEEFETSNSYLIENDINGTKEISRIKERKEYEEKIDEVLIKKKLEEEKKEYEILLKETAERQLTLDVLNYISELPDKKELNADKIAKKLGYKKETVEEILRKILEKQK